MLGPAIGGGDLIAAAAIIMPRRALAVLQPGTASIAAAVVAALALTVIHGKSRAANRTDGNQGNQKLSDLVASFPSKIPDARTHVVINGSSSLQTILSPH